jgi:hypothetical protein
MRILSLSTVCGLLVAMAIIYWLRLSSIGAIGLVVLICVGVSTSIGALLPRRREHDHEKTE